MSNMDDSRIKDAKALLAAFFDEEKRRRGGMYAEFFSSWRIIVGERLAAHSRVVEVEKGTLIVEADHPGWIQLLQLKQTAILAATAVRFPELELRSIVFRLSQKRDAAGSSEKSDAPRSRPGPFGPEGCSLVSMDVPLNEAEDQGSARKQDDRPVVQSIGDPELASVLASLKAAVDEAAKRTQD